MREIDYCDSKRITMLLQLVAEISQAQEPAEVLRAFTHRWTQLHGRTGYVSLSCRSVAPGQYRITRLLPKASGARMVANDPWSNMDAMEVHEGGLLGKIVSGGVPMLMTDLDVRDDPVIGDALSGYRTLMAIPLFDRGRAMNWSIELLPQADAFTVKDLEDALLRNNLVGGTVRQVLTAKKLRAANKLIQEEVERIAAVQRALLPEELPQIPGFKLARSYQTFDRAGGDLYMIEPLLSDPGDSSSDPDGRWIIFMADVSGHGPAAAVMMAIVHTLVVAYPRRLDNAGELLDYLNSQLCAKRLNQAFVTAFAGIIEPNSRRMSYSCAGHPPPIWRKPRSNGQIDIEQLDAVGGLPLGIMCNESYAQAAIKFEPNQALALYTDGIIDTRNKDRKFFGIEGVVGAMRCCEGDPACAVQTIQQMVLQHEDGHRPEDDQTLLLLYVE